MHALRKALVALIITTLVLSGGGIVKVAEASMPHHAAAVQSIHSVQTYADLAIEPGDGDCIDLATGVAPHSHEGKTCNQCCGMCIVFNLVLPIATQPEFSPLRERFPLRETKMAARDVPTEPGIPKPL